MKVEKVESRPGRGVHRLEATDHDGASLQGAVVMAGKRRSTRTWHASSAARSFFLPQLLLSCTSFSCYPCSKRSRKRQESGQSICRTTDAALPVPSRSTGCRGRWKRSHDLEQEAAGTHMTATVLSMSWSMREVHPVSI